MVVCDPLIALASVTAPTNFNMRWNEVSLSIEQFLDIERNQRTYNCLSSSIGSRNYPTQYLDDLTDREKKQPPSPIPSRKPFIPTIMPFYFNNFPQLLFFQMALMKAGLLKWSTFSLHSKLTPQSRCPAVTTAPEDRVLLGPTKLDWNLLSIEDWLISPQPDMWVIPL